MHQLISKSAETPLTDAVIFESHWIIELCCWVKLFLWPVVIIKRADNLCFSSLSCFDDGVHYLQTVSSLKHVLKLFETHLSLGNDLSIIVDLFNDSCLDFICLLFCVFFPAFAIDFIPF